MTKNEQFAANVRALGIVESDERIQESAAYLRVLLRLGVRPQNAEEVKWFGIAQEIWPDLIPYRPEQALRLIEFQSHGGAIRYRTMPN